MKRNEAKGTAGALGWQTVIKTGPNRVAFMLDDGRGVVLVVDWHGGRLVVVGLDMAVQPSGPGPIDAAYLRRIPLTEMERLLNTPEWQVVLREDLTPTLITDGVDLQFTHQEQSLGATRKELRQIVRKGRTGKAWPDRLYELVAHIYLTGGATPTRAVEEAGEVTYTTAARWIREARARDLLPAGQRGKVR